MYTGWLSLETNRDKLRGGDQALQRTALACLAKKDVAVPANRGGHSED